MPDVVVLLAGVVCAGVGGELFVRGVVGIAQWARVPAGLVGATVAAFATSSPELTVAITAARAGTPEIALGDALGSNVVNIALILAIALLGGALHAPRGSLQRDFPAALLAPIVIGLLIFDGRLSRLDGVLLLGLFAAWLTATVVEARRQRSAAGEVLGESRHGLTLLWTALGLVVLVVAGRLIVVSAKAIAFDLGLDAFIVGATVVAIATSTPELATTVIARLRGHAEVGLGTLFGSNVFNSLLVVGVATTISPFSLRPQEVAIGLAFSALAVAITFPRANGLIERRRGFLLLAIFAAYVVAILQGA